MSQNTPVSKKRSSDDDDLDNESTSKTRKLNGSVTAKNDSDEEEMIYDEEEGPTTTNRTNERDLIKQTGFVLNCECRSQPDDLKPSDNKHQILFQINESNQYVPSVLDGFVDRWDKDHVKLACSASNVDERNAKKWPLIEAQLKILSDVLKKDADLFYVQRAILKYNPKYKESWNFKVLEKLLNDPSNKEYSKEILSVLFPKIIDLALMLPKQFPSGIRLLRASMNYSITMTQTQCACLLANAFFCTFPNRNDDDEDYIEYEEYPYINFNHLFNAYKSELKYGFNTKFEKLKCLLHYFNRVTARFGSYTDSLVTYTRQCLGPDKYPDFSRSKTKMRNVLLRLDGVIEDCEGALQVDFANKMIGGGVLNSGCVQEEIRFVICPELLVSLLFTEEMNTNECLLIKGAERFSSYSGYGNKFKWAEDYVDETPRDKLNRRQTEVLAIDALFYRQNKYQFDMNKINRELKKAYTGFYTPVGAHMCCAIATGNWGCGAFNGDRQLKFLIQMMAAAETKRDLIYYTFNDRRTVDGLSKIIEIIKTKDLTVSDLYNILNSYCGFILKQNNSPYKTSVLQYLTNKCK